jgi:hypothetical protein
MFTNAVRTTLLLLANKEPPLLDTPLGNRAMDGLGQVFTTAPLANRIGLPERGSQPQQLPIPISMQNPGAQPLQQDFYQGANGPGPRQRHLQFDEQDMDYYNKGNRMGR